MDRRLMIKSLGAISSHAMFPSILAGFMASCQKPETAGLTFKQTFFTDQEFELLQEVIDLIIPATQSKSASQVNTHFFLDEVFDKCLPDSRKAALKKGMVKLSEAMASPANKLEKLKEIDEKAYQNDPEFAFFRTIKQFTLVGFFTSQEGETIASNYVKFPGPYKGDIEMNEQTLNYGRTDLRFYL